MSKFISSLFIFFGMLTISVSLTAQGFDDLNEQADKEYLNKNYNKAIDLSTQSINIKPNARAYFIRADARYSLYDYEAATNDFTSALSYYSYYYNTDKYKGRIYYWRGMCYYNLSKYNDAISDFNSALSYNYEEPGYVYWNRGNSYYVLEKYQEGDDDYAKAIDRISDSKNLSSLYKYRGDCKAKQRDYSSAYSFYARAISYDPNNYNAYWQRGYYKDLEGKDDDALKDYAKAAEILEASSEPSKNENLSFLYRNQALMYKGLNQYPDALAAINKAIQSDPNFAKAYRTRAEIYNHLKDYEKAKSDYSNAITLQSDKKTKADIYLDRSMMEWTILDYKSCLDDLNKAVENDPADGMNYWHRSLLYGYKKNYSLAITESNTALSLYKNDSSSTASLFWLRASHKEYTGDYNGAAEDYKTYLKYYPDSYSGYYELGRLYKLKMKNNDLANANLSRASDLAEQSADTVKDCYIKVIKGQKDEAVKTMLQIVQSTPKTDDYYYKWNLHNMACIYALAGNIPKAFEYLDKSLAAGFDDYLHLVNDRDLASLMNLPQWKTILAKYKVPQPKL